LVVQVRNEPAPEQLVVQWVPASAGTVAVARPAATASNKISFFILKAPYGTIPIREIYNGFRPIATVLFQL
jgi:hypothetical protein